jgi:hypothetical protein
LLESNISVLLMKRIFSAFGRYKHIIYRNLSQGFLGEITRVIDDLRFPIEVESAALVQHQLSLGWRIISAGLLAMTF